MTWQIALTFALLVATFVSFVREKIAPDITALALLVILVFTGLLPLDQALSVFANPAPLTVAAMFILSAALVKCGAIDRLSSLVERSAGWRYGIVVFLLVIVVGAASAFVNNTPVVVVFLPIVLNLAKKMQLAPSKLLIPLSYAAVLGGTCTLLGTSTNLVVNSISISRGLPPMSLFELAWLGVPVTVIGALYLALAGRRLLPDRQMLTSILTNEERREYITEAYVQPSSDVPGKTLAEAGLVSARGVRVLELVRDGVSVPFEKKTLRLAAGDRLILACRPKGIVHTRGIAGVDLVAELHLNLEQIAAHEGSIVEGMVTPTSDLVGSTLAEINFRQRFRLVVLALHRRGENLRDAIDATPLRAGDVLLMMGTDQAIQALRSGDEIILFDLPLLPARAQNKKLPIAVGVVTAVILTATFDWIPIELGALAGAVALCLTGCLKPKDAYDSIEWPILFLIFGMLAMGLAMERTGAAAFVAREIVEGVEWMVPPAHQALVMLGALYIVATVLTEILSNNAVAALMTPIAIGVAAELGVRPQPFVIAIMFAASAAFATPIGYQTNTYVYGIGGYKFADFLRIGIPLNLLCFVVAMLVIPLVWPF